MKSFRLAIVAAALSALICSLTAVFAITPTGIDSSLQNSYSKIGYSIVSVENALTAFAGGGQTSAYQLAASYSRFTVVGTAADSAKLPTCTTALIGLQMTVANADASDAMNVFPAAGEAINLLSANTAISVAATKGMRFTCVANALWQSFVSG